MEYLDLDEGHETGHFIDWPLEAERTGYLSDGYAVMDCLFSTQLFDSQLMADDGQDKLEEGHIIMPRLRPSKQHPPEEAPELRQKCIDLSYRYGAFINFLTSEGRALKQARALAQSWESSCALPDLAYIKRKAATKS